MKYNKLILVVFLVFSVMGFQCNNDDDSQMTEICDDTVDNDGDGFIDCEDLDCESASNCVEICNDLIDNDGDGFTDCEDNDCASDPNC